VIVLVSVIYGFMTEMIPIPISVHVGVILALLGFIVEKVWDRGQTSSVEVQRSKLASFARTHKLILGEFITEFAINLDNTIMLEADRVTVNHPLLAIASYDDFWKRLVEHQKKSRAFLTIQAIHSCEMDIWVDHPLTKSLLESQKQFCKNGGRICRILCGRGAHPSKSIQRAAELMLEAGIEVYYYNLLDGKVVEHNFAWDFMRIEETGHAVIWDSFAGLPHSVINEAVYCRYSEYKGHNLAALWMNIRAHSVAPDQFLDSFDEELSRA
jgi:hypothetical protein